MTKRKIVCCCLLLVCQFILAQHDSIALDEVIVSDRQLRDFSSAHTVLELNDSIIENNRPSLTNLLNYNSPIYFKENGPNMVSSPSFRGTTAQQTAVVWNGLNINSQFNGQTDFNTVPARSFDAIVVRPGGGSVIYGSSAIGGSVHLNNELLFRPHLENDLSIDYASFSTFGANYELRAATPKFSTQVNLSHNSSDNDFDFPQAGRRNENGQFYNSSGNVAFGVKVNPNNLVKVYSYAFDGQRHFSLVSPTDTKTKYRDRNARALLEWENRNGRMTTKTKLAYIGERYDYFGDIGLEASNHGKAETLLARYDGTYAVADGMHINAIADFSQTKASGSDVAGNTRQIASFTLLFSHKRAKLGYEAGIRQEVTGSYDSPLLFSIGAGYRFSPIYTLKVNGSKNFRIPTFNDLYWADGGNPGLKPESSLQAEIGHVFTYQDFELTVAGYYIAIDEMIQWLPGTTASWHPINVNQVEGYGLENTLRWARKFGFHQFAVSGTYAYTVSENKRTGYQLIYVPYHKSTAALAYSVKRLTADVQFLFCGEVFTRSDNDPHYNIGAYTVSNFGIAYAIGKQPVAKIGARVLNLFDEKYQVVAGRPFPGRNYNLFLNLKF